MPSKIDEIKNSKEPYILDIKVTTNAKKNSLEFEETGEIKLKIKQIPVEGKANKEIISFLSDFLDIPKNRIEIIKGEKSKYKRILIKPA